MLLLLIDLALLWKTPFKQIWYGLSNYSFEVFVDGINHETPSLMIYINNILKVDKDLQHENVEWIQVLDNGWPKILAVTCKDIKRGDLLFAVNEINASFQEK